MSRKLCWWVLLWGINTKSLPEQDIVLLRKANN